jgi:ribosomal protein S18 acetylase RimI-like enzyme
MLIACAKREEIPEVAAFIDTAWRAAYRHILAPAYLASMKAEERADGLLQRFDNGQFRFFIMREENEIVGVVVFGKSFTEGYPDDGEVSALYLRRDRIGKGYGHALLEKAESALTEMGYAAFVIDVFTENERAVKFYTAHGYMLVDERTIAFGEKEYPYRVYRKAI